MNSSSIVSQAIQLKILYYLVNIAEIYVQNIPTWTSNSLKGGKQRGGAFRAKDFIALLVAIVVYVFVEIRINMNNVAKLLQILKFLSNAFEEIQKNPNKIFDLVQNNPQIRSIMQNVLENRENMQAYLIQTFNVKPAILNKISNGVINYNSFENSVNVVIPLAIVVSLLNQRFDFIRYNPGSSMLSNVQSTLNRIQELIEQSMDRIRNQVQQIPAVEPEAPNAEPQPPRQRCLGETCPISLEMFNETNIHDAVIIDLQCYSREALINMLDHNQRNNIESTVPHNRAPFTREKLNMIYGNNNDNNDANNNSAFRAALNREQQLYNERLPSYLNEIQADFRNSYYNSGQATRADLLMALNYYRDADRIENINNRYENQLQQIRNGLERNENIYRNGGPVDTAANERLMLAYFAEHIRLLENRLNELRGGKRKTYRIRKHARRTKRRFIKRS